MRIERIRSSAAAPVSLAEAKTFARVDHDDEDLALAAMIAAAALEIEHHAQIALLTQTIVLTLDDWPADHAVRLPIGPVAAGTVYAPARAGFPLTVRAPVYGARPMFWLDPAECALGPLAVTYTAGFGDTAQALPEDLRMAVCAQVTALYDTRDATDPKVLALSPHTARIAARYRGVKL